jgi:phosphate transport system substrate-binding protein
VATRQGKCTNFGNCEKADKREIIPVPQGADFSCPECGRDLTEVGATTSRNNNALFGGLILAVLLLAAFVTLRACSRSHSSGGFAGLGSSGTPILSLSGSNTIGASLGPALAEAFLKEQGATDVKTLPGANAEEKIVQGVLPGQSSPSIVKIAAHGSATAFTDMASGSTDIGMASRRIKPEEAIKLSSLGDMYAGASEHVLGLDGIAVIVNSANPVTSLRKDQLTHIFSGDASAWSDVGGSGGSIKVYARDDKSGTYDTFKTLVLGNQALVPGAQRFEDSNALSEAVAGDPDGIGFVGLPYVHSARAISVAEKGAMALQPTRLTVATEDYPLSRRLYLYTPANPQNKFTQKFVEFALSHQGQEVVGGSGFVAQNVTPQTQVIAAGAPSDYKQLTSGAERLSLDFRFRTGKSDLDNKAVVDIDRVVTFIADLKYTGDRIMLFGFADSTGSRDANNALSLNRAKVVQDQFSQRGLKPTVVRGFGPDLPVASNDTDEGREKNRRVEIWLRK